MPIDLSQEPLRLQGIISRLIGLFNKIDIRLINLVGDILLHRQILRLLSSHHLVGCSFVVFGRENLDG